LLLYFFLDKGFECEAECFQGLGDGGGGGAVCFGVFRGFGFEEGCLFFFYWAEGWWWYKLAGVNGLWGQAFQLFDNQLRFAFEVDDSSLHQQVVVFLEGSLCCFDVVEDTSGEGTRLIHEGEGEEGFAAASQVSRLFGHAKDGVDFLLEAQVADKNFADTFDLLWCMFWVWFCFFRLTHVAPMPNGVYMRTFFFVLLSFIVGQAVAGEPQWEIATRKSGITVFARKAEGENIAEVKAIGLIRSSPEEVWKILVDFDNYTKSMPYTEVSRCLSREGEGKTFYFYTVLNPPVVSRRDYVLRLRDESEWKEGAGFLKLTWKVAEDSETRVPPKSGMVRLKLSDGYWLLEPREGGKATFATYYVLTDGGGSLPAWIINQANKTAAPNVILAVRKAVEPAKK